MYMERQSRSRGKTEAMKRRGLRCDGSFDIETEGWSTYVVGGLKAHGERIITWDANKLMEHMLRLACADFSTVLYGHNGGRYDDLWFLSELVELGFADFENIGISLAGGRIVRVEVGNLTLLDSAAIIPFRLEKAAGMGGVRKVDTDLPCVCAPLNKRHPNWRPQYLDMTEHELVQAPWARRGCGGYCSIRRGMPRALRSRLEWYLEHDIDAVPSMLGGLESFAATHDIDLCVTLGASSWRTARRRLGLPDANWKIGRLKPQSVYNFVRAAYFGGRCQVGRPQAERVWSYDITSAYPFALSQVPLPIGEPREEAGGAKSYAAGLEGVYSATVMVPKGTHVPPLPVRVGNGNGSTLRIAYPTGELAGTWCGNELRNAEAAGARIISFSTSIVWPESAVLFGDWLTEIGELRQGFKNESKAIGELPVSDDEHRRKRYAEAMAEWLKWFPNSVTGKLAQHPETEELVMNPDRSQLGCPSSARCFGVGCSKQLGCCPHKCYGTCAGQGLLPLGRPKYRLFSRDVYQLTSNMHVVWSGYLTANTRGQWLRQAVDDGQDGRTWVYGDTDNVKATAERHQDVDVDGTNQFGLWKLEGVFRDWYAMAPKTYDHWNEETGEVISRSKGVLDAARNFRKLANGETVVSDRGVMTLKTAARHKGDVLFARKWIERRVKTPTCDVCGSRHFGDRILGADGLTHAQDVDSYHECDGSDED